MSSRKLLKNKKRQKRHTLVHVTIEAKAEAAVAPDDPTGWKAIDALRGIVKDAPTDVAKNHDKYLNGAPHE